MSHKSLLQNSLRIIVSFIFIAGSVYFLRDKWTHAFQLLKQIDLGMFLEWVLLIYIINILIVSYRLFLILKVEGVGTNLFRVTWLSFVGLFFNLFLPSSLGGDIVKAYYLARGSKSSLRTISAVIVDRFLGLGAMMVMAVIALPLFTQEFSDNRLVIAVIAFAAAFALVIIVFLNESLAKKLKFLAHLVPSQHGKQKLKELYDAIARFRRHKGYLLAGFLLSLAIQVISIVNTYLISKSIGMNVAFITLMLIIPVSAMASMVPSLGGLGVREASLIYFLSHYSSPAMAGAFTLAYDILIYGSGLICGILFAVFGGRIKEGQVKTHDR